MSAFVYAAPEELAAASSSLSSLGLSIREAHAASAGLTTSIAAAAEDEVSAAVAKLFGGYAQQFQALGAQASLFHDQFVQALNGGGFLYAATEATSASPLQAAAAAAVGVQDAINAPFLQFTGRPLVGPGTDGAPGTGQAGGPGGWLWGDGGDGGSGTPGTATSPAGGAGGAGGSAFLFGSGGHGGSGGTAYAGSGAVGGTGGNGGAGGLIFGGGGAGGDGGLLNGTGGAGGAGGDGGSALSGGTGGNGGAGGG
ncbi:PE family protein, partial [Mycobacterium ulcerans]